MKCMLHLADFALYGFFWADWAAAATLLEYAEHPETNMQIVAAVRLASRLAREHACTPQLNPDASAEKSLKPLSGLIPVPSGLSPSLLTLSDSVSLCICSSHDMITHERGCFCPGRPGNRALIIPGRTATTRTRTCADAQASVRRTRSALRPQTCP